MRSERIEYLDAIKGAAIFWVVFCHQVVLPNESVIGNIFMSFAWAAVPSFFMVTGGVMHNTSVFSWKKYLNRILKVYITLSVWKLIYLCFYIYIDKISVEYLSVIKYLFFMGNIEGVDTNPMWFMCAYLQVLFLFPITYFLHKNEEGRKNLVFLLVVMWFISFFVPFMKVFNINIFDNLLDIVPFYGFKSMFFYFVLGIFLYDYRDEIKSTVPNVWIRKMIPYLMITVGLVLAVIFKYSYTGSFGWNGIYLSNGYNRISTMLMGIGFYMIFLFEGCPKILVSCFKRIGKYTMGIYYLHYPMLILYKKICHELIENYSEYYSCALNMLQTIIVVGICLLITVIARKIPGIKRIFV